MLVVPHATILRNPALVQHKTFSFLENSPVWTDLAGYRPNAVSTLSR